MNSDQRVLRLLQEARLKLETERKRRTEPIAIVGIGCRFPGGASSPAAFWRMLASGVDATNDVPADRWNADALYDPDPAVPGKCYVKRGGFLEAIDGFDPEFFGISPREAVGLDPQQRLLLEVAWEALEDGGIRPETLRASATGVWIGLSLDDYAGRTIASGDLGRIDPYSALGNARSVAAGRIAYVLDLHGPVMQVDASCASSLVAVHLACQSLRAGECDLALVGGVNVMSSPATTVALCKLQALSRDGRCKTFDAEADGYGRGEGCGVVVLKRLADAQAANDRIHALIRGTAINHDGRSNGLTAPNGVAQEAVIRAALANANLEAPSVGYVEAHGTGTLLGDPIEVLALNRVYGHGRSPRTPLYLGSVKTNFGHLEGAAGIAGLTKTVLCLSHRQLVPHLHFRQPNPKIPWRDLAVRVATEAMKWPGDGSARIAGVSSFGISGTNAHVILEEAPAAAEPSPAPARSAELIVLSARTDAALKEAAGRLRGHVEVSPGLSLGDLAYSLLTARSSMECRSAFAVTSQKAMCEALEAFTNDGVSLGETAPSLSTHPRVAFVFPGQGSQWLGMGRELLAEEPAFRDSMVECDQAILEETGWSAIEELKASAESSRLKQIEVVQPVLFAVEVALAALWRSWGVEPHAVVGHSMGEVAAACVSGALSLRDGAAVICRRSSLLRRIRGQGEMALVELSMIEAKAALVGFERQLGVAVSNGKRSTVLSGEPKSLAEVLSRLEARGVFCRRVKVDVASHSPQVDPLLEELAKALDRVTPRPALVPMHSTVTGALLTGSELGAGYWADNLRSPVCFGQTIEGLIAEGFTLFVEMSPHPLLVPAIEELRRESGIDGVAVGSLRRDQAERRTLLESLGALHRHGHELDASRLFPSGGRRVELPTYPWQRRRYWTEASSLQSADTGTGHPLLGQRIPSAGTDAVYQSFLSARAPSWLSAHRVAGQVVVPGSALAEMTRAAAEEHRGGLSCEVQRLVLRVPLLLRERDARRIQVVLTEDGARASIYSQPANAASGTGWTLHATAQVDAAPEDSPSTVDVAALRVRCSEPVDVAATYAAFTRAGLQYGPAFQGLQALWRGQGEALAEVRLAEGLEVETYGLHPALLDGAMQVVAALMRREQPYEALLPFELGRFAVHRFGAPSVLVHARLAECMTPDGMLVADLTLTDPSGRLVAQASGLHLRRADMAMLGREELHAPPAAMHRLEWRQAQPPAPPLPPRSADRWVVVALGAEAEARRLVEGLSASGAGCERVDVARLGQVAAEHAVCLWEAGGEAAEEAIRAAQQGLSIVRALSGNPNPPRLWWVTHGAVAVGPNDDARVASSSLWGLGRTVMQELPDLRCTLLDLQGPGSSADLLVREATASDDETQVAWRGDKRHVLRLARAPAAPLTPEPGTYPFETRHGGPPRIDGTMLVTGGLGTLGLEVARLLANRGVRHLVLVGRRGLATPGAPDAATELEALGARVTVAAVDVADRESLARVLAAVPPELPLRGVVHAAGVLDDGVLLDQTPERFARVMKPKVWGAWNLHSLTRRADLDLFVLFSSIAGTLGSGGQGGYAAANTFLDALAAHRRAQGLAGLSLAWGPWAERGLAAAGDASLQARFGRKGLTAIPIQQGRALFEAALGRPEAQLVVAPIDLRAVAKAHEGSVPPLWRALVRASAPRAPETTGNWARELEALPVEERARVVTSAVRTEVARVLSFGRMGVVPAEKPLKDLGLDSLMALELRSALARRTGLTLPATLVFHHPTAQAIAKHLLAKASELARVPGDEGTRAAAHCERLNSLGAPQIRLLCFHDAGGSATMFTPFCQMAASGVEVHAISNARSGGPGAASARQYLAEAVAYIHGLTDRPYALFGHSLGGLFAWRVVQELAHEGASLPALLVQSASGLSMTPRSGSLADDVEEAFRLIRPPELRPWERDSRGGAQTTDHMKAEFTADALLWRSMPQREPRAVDVPIAAFVGRNDHVVSESAMRSWAQSTTRDFSLTVLPGGHFYLGEERSRQLLLEELARRLDGRPDVLRHPVRSRSRGDED